jgi:hypothetical protein
MQKKIVLIVVLLTFLIIVPALAAPKAKKPKVEKINFTSNAILLAGSSSIGEQVTTETGILYIEDAISVGYIEADADSPISGLVWTNLSGAVDLNTMLGSFDGKWTITTDKGNFEGSLVGVVAVATVSGKFVGYGIGYLAGQKIKGSFEGTVNNYVVDLTLTGKLTSK